MKEIRNEKKENGLIETITCYEEADIRYTKLGRRYIWTCAPIVCFYGCVLLVMPVNDLYHHQMDASDWPNLFKVS